MDRPRPIALPADLPFVGRETPLETLRHCIDAVALGKPALAMVTGPPGIGKTRTVRASLTSAAARGFTVIATRAHSASRDLMLGTVVQLVDSLLNEVSERDRDALVDGLNPLAFVLPGIALDPPVPLGDPLLERTRIVGSVLKLVQRCAALGPLALFIDDAHLADVTSLEVVAQLTRTVADRTVFVALAYQPIDAAAPGVLDAAGILAGFESDSAGAPGALPAWDIVTLRLGALSLEETGELIARALGGPASPELVAQLQTRGDSTPGLIESLLRARVGLGEIGSVDGCFTLAVEVDPPLPHDVLAAMRTRFARLDEPARRILLVLAVEDGGIGDAALVAATGLDHEGVLDGLAQLVRHQLASSEAAPFGGYHLVHELVRDAVLADLSALETARAHLAVADALGSRSVEDSRVNAHLLEAGPCAEPERVMWAAVAEGRRSLEAGSNERAVTLLGSSLEYARSHGTSELVTSLLVDLGDACSRCGDLSTARRVWHEALDGFRSDKRSTEVAGVHRRLALLEWDEGKVARALAEIAAGHEVLDGLEPHRGTRRVAALRNDDSGAPE